MGEGYNFEQLRERILAFSEAKDWEVARKEWALVDVYQSGEPDTCLCGHFPIVEICVISNRITKKSTEVGNVCVRRFLGFRSDLIFSAIKKIRKDPTKSLNADAITFFRDRSLLTTWEYGFLQNTKSKRNLTPAQLETRKRINNKVLVAVARRGFRGPDE
jgi:hypothetical protein